METRSKPLEELENFRKSREFGRRSNPIEKD